MEKVTARKRRMAGTIGSAATRPKLLAESMVWDEFLKTTQYFGRLHLQTIQHFVDAKHPEVRVDGPEDTGELTCFTLKHLQNLRSLMIYEKRTDVTLLTGNDGVYLMLNDKAAGRRVWSLDELLSMKGHTPHSETAVDHT